METKVTIKREMMKIKIAIGYSRDEQEIKDLKVVLNGLKKEYVQAL